MHTPAYIFHVEEFHHRLNIVQKYIGTDIPLCFSMKANPFLLEALKTSNVRIEVCSPGELQICKHLQIAGSRIIYSGVMKEATDIQDAISYGVGILTAESPSHLTLENQISKQAGKKCDVILRLTSGNQFGMSEAAIRNIISKQDMYPNLHIAGIHYYSGTQKKHRSIEKELQYLDTFLTSLEEEYHFMPELVEYGPGLAVNYFNPPYDEAEIENLQNFANTIQDFAKKYPVGIEMGRFLATPCGYYITQIKDIKRNNDSYIICDGGMHHLNYYGQTMAMQTPPIQHLRTSTILGSIQAKSTLPDTLQNYFKNKDFLYDLSDKQYDPIPYTICGSLCTVADVLVKHVPLKKACVGDFLIFGRCGAYSVTEGASLFLSRNLPEIYFYSDSAGLEQIRPGIASSEINRRN